MSSSTILSDSQHNWTGYVLTSKVGGEASYVSGLWTIPKVNCSSPQEKEVFIWVGLGGQGSNPLEQVGTELQCFQGTYYSFGAYEFWPSENNSVRITGFSFLPGDVISASVRLVNSSAYFGFELRDLNRTAEPPVNFEKAAPNNSSNIASAEWIVEAPSFPHNVRHAFPNFVDVTFANSSAIVGGQSVSIANVPANLDLRATWYLCDGLVMVIPGPVDTKSAGFTVNLVNGNSCQSSSTGTLSSSSSTLAR